VPVDLQTEVLLDGLMLPEGPRWHAGKLWFSDLFAQQIRTIDVDARTGPIVEVPGAPAGLGWLPDGRLLVVSMMDRCLLRLDSDGFVTVADLSSLMSGLANDMVVDQAGRAYIGDTGFNVFTGQPYAPGALVLVQPDGVARVVADKLDFTNGMVITPNQRTLIVGETGGERLTAFDLEPDGSLTHRRVWAQIGGRRPDGICLDEEGAVWVASPLSGEVVRVREGGDVTHRIRVATIPFACMLGGPDRRSLFVLTSTTINIEEARARRSGRVEVVRVEVPGAGWP
jgi:sugar lactone lactonase YvrE